MSASPVSSSPSAPSVKSGERSAPSHVAIIMDGNGRWAKARGLPRRAGHRAGVEAARKIVESAGDLGIKCLTLYSFSTENWRRPVGEIKDLMGLLKEFIIDDLPRLKKEGVCVRIIGDKKSLSPDIKALINRAEKETADNTKFTLQIAFNYGGRDEIIRAVRASMEAVAKGELDPGAINEASFSTFLDTKGDTDPDLVIRTSGEQRTSNFLIWQAAYAEYVFTDVLWPDFDAKALGDALDEYNGRERRYGGVGEANGR